MIDLSRVAPVIDAHIDPRLSVILRDTPASIHVIFAGPDAVFLDALRRIYGVPLPCPDALVCVRAGHVLVVVAAHDEADGLLIDLKLDESSGLFYVWPVLIFTPNRSVGAEQRIQHLDADHANLVIAALENLIFRRVMPAESAS